MQNEGKKIEHSTKKSYQAMNTTDLGIFSRIQSIRNCLYKNSQGLSNGFQNFDFYNIFDELIAKIFPTRFFQKWKTQKLEHICIEGREITTIEYEYWLIFGKRRVIVEDLFSPYAGTSLTF